MKFIGLILLLHVTMQASLYQQQTAAIVAQLGPKTKAILLDACKENSAAIEALLCKLQDPTYRIPALHLKALKKYNLVFSDGKPKCDK